MWLGHVYTGIASVGLGLGLGLGVCVWGGGGILGVVYVC